MRKLFNDRAFLCSIYDLDSRKSEEVYKLGVEEDLNGKKYFVLADPPYNVLRNQNIGNAEYGVSGSNDMKRMDKDLGDIVRLEAHEHVICFALQFAL